MSRLYLLLVLCLSHSPLFAESTTEVAGSQAIDPQQLFYDVVYERLSTDGEQLLCEQEAYTACHDFDKAACMKAQSAHKPDCLEAYQASIKENTAANHTFAFMQCMKEKQIASVGGAESEAGICTEKAMKTFKSSPYSQRIEAVFSLVLSNHHIASDLCDSRTLFACPMDEPDSCKARINANKDGCMAEVKQEILETEPPLEQSQAAQKYMSCLLIKNDCKEE
ncbi:MAG: hypothetical protein ACPGSM_10585 [Thiolinea sp.]